MATKEKEHKPTAGERRALKRREAAAKAEAVFGTGKGSAEPIIDPKNYKASLMNALNYYNNAFDNKDKRKWTLAYIGKGNKELDSLPDYEFRSIGTMIRMKQREVHLEKKELDFIDLELARLRELAVTGKVLSSFKVQAEEPKQKPVVSVQDRIAEAASTHIAEIDGLIDDFILNDTEVSIESYLKSNEVSAAVTKLIPPFFARITEEIREAIKGEDKQLVEGYSNFKKVKLRKLLKLYESINDACAQQVVVAKAQRKPTVRKVREKPATVVASKVKYMKACPELGLKSITPDKIIGASEVWIYNVKYKKFYVYRSQGALGIKGSAILNYEVATSGCKTIRKPEEVLKTYADMTKRTFAQEFKTIKTKEAAVNGRINSECIILKVF